MTQSLRLRGWPRGRVSEREVILGDANGPGRDARAGRRAGFERGHTMDRRAHASEKVCAKKVIMRTKVEFKLISIHSPD
jgi:hypothetical protein